MDFLNVGIIHSILDTITSLSNVSIQVPMSHVMLFSFFLIVFFLLGSTRGIAVTSFIFALNLGVMQNMGLLMEGLNKYPILWVPYVVVGTFFFVVLFLGLMYQN
jgi:hypothetical protein